MKIAELFPLNAYPFAFNSIMSNTWQCLPSFENYLEPKMCIEQVPYSLCNWKHIKKTRA